MTNPNSQFRPLIPQKTVTATTYTIAREDNGYDIYFTSASAVTVTVGKDATNGIGEGFSCNVIQYGAGALTVAAGTGATVNTPETLVLAKQYAAATLTHTETASVWLFTGYLTAA